MEPAWEKEALKRESLKSILGPPLIWATNQAATQNPTRQRLQLPQTPHCGDDIPSDTSFFVLSCLALLFLFAPTILTNVHYTHLTINTHICGGLRAKSWLCVLLPAVGQCHVPCCPYVAAHSETVPIMSTKILISVLRQELQACPFTTWAPTLPCTQG